jgi:transcriptional regulator with XRE-family HTH domain
MPLRSPETASKPRYGLDPSRTRPNHFDSRAFDLIKARQNPSDHVDTIGMPRASIHPEHWKGIPPDAYRRVRQAAGLRQKDVALAEGINVSSVWRREHRKYGIQRETFLHSVEAMMRYIRKGPMISTMVEVDTFGSANQPALNLRTVNATEEMDPSTVEQIQEEARAEKAAEKARLEKEQELRYWRQRIALDPTYYDRTVESWDDYVIRLSKL